MSWGSQGATGSPRGLCGKGQAMGYASPNTLYLFTCPLADQRPPGQEEVRNLGFRKWLVRGGVGVLA